ncbi:hypothetical protein [Peteryoungia desertarenae]|uniref:hypothetical protein n=1 Tax=Peteryoungia desertarenae TaxID=1813451 RepID=UPI001AEE92AA|nr:hypothetical protein [Peteryoungia desertarenae]
MQLLKSFSFSRSQTTLVRQQIQFSHASKFIFTHRGSANLMIGQLNTLLVSQRQKWLAIPFSNVKPLFSQPISPLRRRTLV